MKDIRKQEHPQSQQHVTNSQKPENKDNLDSRERKENSYTERSNQEGKKPNSRDKDKHGA